MDMDAPQFESLVAEVGFSPVPLRFRPLIENVALLVEDDVPEETRRSLDMPPEDALLGLYQGVPRTARGDGYGIGGALPDTITLYRLPILQAAAEDGIPVRQMIEETIWHEVAHHFGLEEREVEAREAERRAEERAEERADGFGE